MYQSNGQVEQLCEEDWENLKCLLVEPALAANLAEIQVLSNNNLVSDCSRFQKGGRTPISTNPIVSNVTAENTFDFYKVFLTGEGQDEVVSQKPTDSQRKKI